MADKYIYQNAGQLTEREGLVTSAGAGDTGKIVALDATGKLDTSLLPTGIGADTASIQATEALSAGDLVNIYDSGSSTFRCRKADASSSSKEAHGFVLAAVSNGANATIYFEGSNSQVSGLAPGNRFLSGSTPGGTTSTAPSTTGHLVQLVGVATSATVLNFEAQQSIVLA